ncbi:MAG: hypothetical protein Q7T33_09095 [Dehalococcoidia bacterium]|nr:hypothetical protein [Dehalococcoidia bacterium]MDO8732121.1 hypothetical protein [Actinomycetota bacterium]
MEQPKKRGVGRPRGKHYPRVLVAYETEAGARLVAELAERRGTSIASLLRQLVREEAARLGVKWREEEQP